MKMAEQRRLRTKGWRVGSAQEFLGLSDADSAFIEFKLRLARSLRAKRLKWRIRQTELAKLIRSSQSRVAKMEGGDASVSLDLLVRSHLALGTTTRELGQILSR